MRLRLATAGDIGALVELEAGFPPPDRMTRRNWRNVMRGGAYVALAETTEPAPLGAVAVLFRRGARIARLYSLSVRPEARGRGLAKALLRDGETAAALRGCARMRLEVRMSNAGAVSLYEGAGYRIWANAPGYYPDGESALRMEKCLAPTKDRAA